MAALQLKRARCGYKSVAMQYLKISYFMHGSTCEVYYGIPAGDEFGLKIARKYMDELIDATKHIDDVVGAEVLPESQADVLKALDAGTIPSHSANELEFLIAMAMSRTCDRLSGVATHLHYLRAEAELNSPPLTPESART